MPRDKYYEAALKFCQEHGYEGDELPPFRAGYPSMSCPVTVALEPFGVEASGGGTAILKDHSGVWDGGPDVAKFMDRADSGYYPELGEPHYTLS